MPNAVIHGSVRLKMRILKLEAQQSEDTEIVYFECLDWVTYDHVFDREPQGRAQQLLCVSMATDDGTGV